MQLLNFLNYANKEKVMVFQAIQLYYSSNQESKLFRSFQTMVYFASLIFTWFLKKFALHPLKKETIPYPINIH